MTENAPYGDWDATNSVRLCHRCEEEQGVTAGADPGDTACAACGQHDAPHVYPHLTTRDATILAEWGSIVSSERRLYDTDMALLERLRRLAGGAPGAR
jgi:hypothetical protein